MAQLHVVHAFPGWASALLLVAIVGILIAGVSVVARAAKRMSRPGRIVVGLVAVWTVGAAITVFVDADRPTGDWRGGVVAGSFVVLYGLVAAGIVWVVDKAAKRLRSPSPV
jgi:Na+/melibiose symporter-like transporter